MARGSTVRTLSASSNNDCQDGRQELTRTREPAHLRRDLTRTLSGIDLDWDLRYLAGRTDQALTHLARAVDAAVIIVGSRAPYQGARMREFVEGSVAVHLAHHQHRPVLTVPLDVVDWKARTPW